MDAMGRFAYILVDVYGKCKWGMVFLATKLGGYSKIAAGISPCSVGNTSSFRVHFPASHVSWFARM